MKIVRGIGVLCIVIIVVLFVFFFAFRTELVLGLFARFLCCGTRTVTGVILQLPEKILGFFFLLLLFCVYVQFFWFTCLNKIHLFIILTETFYRFFLFFFLQLTFFFVRFVISVFVLIPPFIFHIIILIFILVRAFFIMIMTVTLLFILL